MATRAPTSLGRSFERIVAALVQCIVRERAASDAPRIEEITRIVLGQHARMPAHLRAGVLLATLGFGWGAVLHAARPFHAATPLARSARLERWRRARLPACRDLVRFWESLVVYGCFAASEPNER